MSQTISYVTPSPSARPAPRTIAAIVVAAAAWITLLWFAVCSDVGVAVVGVPIHDWMINALPRGPMSVDGFRDGSLVLLLSVLALLGIARAKDERPRPWLTIFALHLCGFGLLAWLVILLVHFVPPLPPSVQTLRLMF
jgi:hypothetical protein